MHHASKSPLHLLHFARLPPATASAAAAHGSLAFDLRCQTTIWLSVLYHPTPYLLILLHPYRRWQSHCAASALPALYTPLACGFIYVHHAADRTRTFEQGAMSEAHHPYPIASTSYYQPPSDTASRRPYPSVHHRHAPASSHPNFSHDIYIPESQEELNRISIESRLLQPSGPKHHPDMRAADLTSASSTFDTYDRIGRDDDVPSVRRPVPTTAVRQSRLTNMPETTQHHHQFDADESLIPGVGRGVRSTVPSQTTYQQRLRSLNHNAPPHLYESSPARSPYRPGKYSSAYEPPQARQTVPSSSTRPLPSHARPGAFPRQPQVESESESDGDSASDSGASDAINIQTATFNSTGNHRNFAATPAGHTATMTANLRQRPTLGQDTLDRIEFDFYTDTDGEHRSRRDKLQTRSAAQHHQNTKPRPDPSGPFASSRATNTFGMNAADYQQHLASRTLTSPALRTLMGDRSKSPDSPTPVPSIDGILSAGKNPGRETHRQQAQQQQQSSQAIRRSSVSAVSAFEGLARRLQRDVELTRRGGDAGGDEMDDGSASNSGGSGFGPGSQASSARTRVEPHDAPSAGKPFNAAHFNSNGYPVHHKSATVHEATSPWGVRLPDMTGLTSALGSPVKARDTVKHRSFDNAVGNQDARLDEIVNLRCFIDGIQAELDRAGERILNLEQAQEQQSHEFQGLRSEMQTALKDVRATQPASDEHLVQLILQKLQTSTSEHVHQKQPVHTAAKETVDAPLRDTNVHQPTSRNPAAPLPASALPERDGRSQIEVVNRLYAELDKLRTSMEEHYRHAAEVQGKADVSTTQHAAYRHQDNLPTGSDPWDAIEALRLQVLSLADEVEGLNGLVLDHLVPQSARVADGAGRNRHARSSAARHERYYDDAHPASDPVQHPVRSSHRGERFDIRTDPVDQDGDEQYHRRVSFGRAAAYDEDFDRTMDAMAENLRTQRERQRRRRSASVQPAVVDASDELDEAEISQLAESRAARAAARAGTRHTHDSRLCTVCSSHLRSDKRKASRRARLLAAEQRREAIELEESILLNTLDPPPTTTGPHNATQFSIAPEHIATLRTMLHEHWDEFLHQRMLYSELADELKSISPTMAKPKRTILAQHVLDAVESLELKADRIERLERVIANCTDHRQGLPPSPREEAADEKLVKKVPGSRSTSRTSPSTTGGNRLKHALESFERRQANLASPQPAPVSTRNSPPTTLQL